jgi:branched-chain amino acid transport system substrate-binding protein
MKTTAVAIAAVTLLAACSSGAGSKNDGSGKTYRVTFIGPLSGSFGGNNIDMQIAGTKLAINQINAAGGILGRKLNLTTIDTKGDPTTAVSLMQSQLSSSTPPDLVLSEGVTAPPLYPLLTQHKILNFTSLAATTVDSPSGHEYTFNILPSSAGEGDVLANYVKSKGWSKVAIAYADDDYARGEEANYVAALQKNNITVNAVKYADTALDVSPILQQLEAKHPDALAVVGFGAPVAHALTSLQTLGWKPPLLGSPATASSNLPALVPASAFTGMQIVMYKFGIYVPVADRTATFNAFLTGIKKQVPIKASLTNPALFFDAVQLTALAAKQANSISSKALKSELENLNQPASKPYVGLSTESFSATNHRVTSADAEFAMVALGDGTLVDGMLGAPAGAGG